MREIDRIIPSETYQEHNCPICLKKGKTRRLKMKKKMDQYRHDYERREE